MDPASCPLLLQDFTGEFEPARVVTDAGYYSACGSLSPHSSCSSPPPCWWGPDPTQAPAAETGGAGWPAEKPRPKAPAQSRTCDRTRGRSRNPGKKRQSASEREKFRMRDLTKALHHLRTYLPPSVAPAGQALTKIETLRLTIRYISFLSLQLAGGAGSPEHVCLQTAHASRAQYQPCLTSTLTTSASQMETQSSSSMYHRNSPPTTFPGHAIQHHAAQWDVLALG